LRPNTGSSIKLSAIDIVVSAEILEFRRYTRKKTAAEFAVFRCFSLLSGTEM
jgi:hypothetical protein